MFHIRGSIAEQDGLNVDEDALEWILIAVEGVDVDRVSTFAALQSQLVRVIRDAASHYAEFWHTRLSEDTQSELKRSVGTSPGWPRMQ